MTLMKKMGIIALFLFLGVGIALAQTQVVKGSVVDESGEPIIGATVSVKGTTTGTITDVDGKFQIAVANNVTTLTFSYVGHTTADVKISPNMRVVMASASTELTEVVVTGMTSMDKRLFTGGATDRLKSEDIKIDGMPEITRALEGRSAGGFLSKMYREHLVQRLRSVCVERLPFMETLSRYGLWMVL